MRIVLVNRYFHPDESATSRMVSSLAFGLAQHGHPVEALAGRRLYHEAATILPRRETVGGVRIHRLAMMRRRQGLTGRALDVVWFQASAAFWCAKHLRRDDLLIACTDPPLLSVGMALAAALRGARLVNWQHDIFPEVAIELDVLARRSLTTWSAVKCRDWSLQRAERNVVPTVGMAQALRTSALAPERVHVIPYWSEDEIRPIAPAMNRLRDAWGLRDAFVVGYSGNFGRAHEFETLIEAATLLKDEADTRFLLIGSGHGHARVEAEIARRALGNILLKPMQPRCDLADSLSASDVHLISLRPELEPYVVPSKLYGIMAAGRPCLFIGAGNGEVAETLRRHDCGEQVAIGASRELARRIAIMRDTPIERLEMGRRARRAFEREYSRDGGILAWLALLSELGMDPAQSAALADT